jgi:ABC-type glycerol-3-phosphate transport system permease component
MVDRRPVRHWLAHADPDARHLHRGLPGLPRLRRLDPRRRVISNGQMPLWPGPQFLENYYRTIFIGATFDDPRAGRLMMLNSLIMAMASRSARSRSRSSRPSPSSISAFPFRMTAFWMIFITLMLPVEVRIYPTYKVVADLGCSTPMPA